MVLGGFLVLVLLASPASAQDGEASAHAQPSQASPGDDIDLVFRIGPPDSAEVVVQERVNCTVSFPDGRERSPCGRSGSAVEVRNSGDGPREYVFAYQAPALDGTYELTFRATEIARTPPSNYTATTEFVVDTSNPAAQGGPGVDPSDPDAEVDQGDPSGDGPPGADGADGAEGADGNREGRAEAAVRTDQGRVVVSSSMAAGVAVTALVANRWPIGGG